MKVLDKKTAGILYAYGYKIYLRNGSQNGYEIESIHDGYFRIIIGKTLAALKFVDIGENYWILARPLGQLTKVIEVNGETFVPMDELFMLFGGGAYLANSKLWKAQLFEDIMYSPYNTLTYQLAEKLFEWHFALNLETKWWKPIKD